MDFDDIVVGQELPTIRKGPMSTAHIMRWSASMENWHKIHYDWRYATSHDKLPDVMVNGSWKQHVLVQLLTDWVGEAGWVWRMNFQFRSMNIPGDTLTAWGRVKGKEVRGEFGLIDVEMGLKDQSGIESSPGGASIVLSLRGGRPVPYPFDPATLS
jgi:acyl dehydratase